MLLETFVVSIFNEIWLKRNHFSKIKDLHFSHFNKEETFNYSENDWLTIYRVAKCIKVLERRAIWKPLCYNKALTTIQILKKRNIDASLKIGFRKKDDEFDGHAWVKCNELIVSGKVPNLDSYALLK